MCDASQTPGILDASGEDYPGAATYVRATHSIIYYLDGLGLGQEEKDVSHHFFFKIGMATRPLSFPDVLPDISDIRQISISPEAYLFLKHMNGESPPFWLNVL